MELGEADLTITYLELTAAESALGALDAFTSNLLRIPENVLRWKLFLIPQPT
jgi:hypothetical protein